MIGNFGFLLGCAKKVMVILNHETIHVVDSLYVLLSFVGGCLDDNVGNFENLHFCGLLHRNDIDD